MEIPESVERLIALIGFNAAIKIVMTYREQGRLYIPNHKQCDFFGGKHPLSQILTPQQFEQLCQKYGGTTLEIPRLSHQFKLIRNQHIRQLKQEGAKITTLMQEYNLSRRSIFNVLNSQ